MCDCPIHHGLDTIQSVTYLCHGLDSHPGQSRIGHPICDWDWTLFKIIQSQSRIGRPIRDTQLSRIGHPSQVTDWTSKPWLGLDDFQKCPIPVMDWTSNPWLGLDGFQKFPIPVTDWTSNPWLAWMTVQSVTYVCHGLDTVQSVAVWTIVNSSQKL